MVDKANKWIIDVELSSSKALSQYEDMLKKMSSLDKKYTNPNKMYSGGSFGTADRIAQQKQSNLAQKMADKERLARIRSAPSSRIGTAIGGGMKLDVDIERQISKLSRLNLPVGQVERFKDQLRGIRSELNMAQSSRSIIKLRGEFRDTTSQIKQMAASQDKLNKKISLASRLGDQFGSSLKRAGIAAASIYAIGSVGGAIFRVGRDMDSMRASLLAASGSAEVAAGNFEFLKKEANRLGTDIQQGVSGFNRIAVAARGAGLSVEESRHIFSAASEAATTFQLDNQRTGLVMLAFSQMMSKGRVSMEELSRQLGENLPVTLKAAEMATGKTTAEVIKLVESGKLLSKDFIIPFSTNLKKLVREAGALEAATKKMASQQKRMNNEWKILVDDIFQENAARIFGDLFKFIAKALRDMRPFLKDLGTMTMDIVSGVLYLVEAVWDLGTSLANIPGVGGAFLVFWKGVKILFMGIKSSIYGVLWAYYELLDAFEKKVDSKPSSVGPLGMPTQKDLIMKWYGEFKDSFRGSLSGQGPPNSALGLSSEGALGMIRSDNSKPKSVTSIGEVNFNINSDNAEEVGKFIQDNYSDLLGVGS